MPVARTALLVIALIVIASGSLMIVAGEVWRGLPVLAASSGPLWLRWYLGQQQPKVQ